MAVTTNKQRLLTHLFAQAGKARDEAAEDLPVFEQFIYGVCREGSTRELADDAFRNLRERFFDWNEIRVSSVREIEEALAELPESEVKAQRLVTFLQEVFETTFSFDLESMRKKGLKQAAKQLSRYQAANDYLVAWVTQKSLGGHAIPVDGPTIRVCQRLGLLDSTQDEPESARATLEHLVPKARGNAFCEAVSNIASAVCWEGEPNCPACPLNSDCPTGQELLAANATAARAPRAKSR